MGDHAEGQGTLSQGTVYIFDLDRTLYPLDHDIYKDCIHRVFEWVSQKLDISYEEARELNYRYKKEYGGSPLEGLVKNHGVLHEEFLEWVHDVEYHKLQPCEDTNFLIDQLPGRKIVLTNSPHYHAHKALHHLGLTHYFENVYDLTWAEYEMKPKRRVFERVLADMNIDGTQCVMVEDSVENLEPAKNLGMRTVHITHQPVQETYVDETYTNLLSWLQKEVSSRKMAA